MATNKNLELFSSISNKNNKNIKKSKRKFLSKKEREDKYADNVLKTIIIEDEELTPQGKLTERELTQPFLMKSNAFKKKKKKEYSAYDVFKQIMKN